MMLINKLRSSSQGGKHKGVISTKLANFDTWEKAKISKKLDGAKTLVSADATHLIDIAKRFGKGMTEDQYVN